MLNGVIGNWLMTGPASACMALGKIPIRPPVKPTNSAACALQKFGSAVHRLQQLSGLRISSGMVTGMSEMLFPNSVGTGTAAQVDGYHHAQQPSLSPTSPCASTVAPERRSHQGENDVVDAGSDLVPDGLHFRQRNLGPGELLRSVVDHVKPQPLA